MSIYQEYVDSLPEEFKTLWGAPDLIWYKKMYFGPAKLNTRYLFYNHNHKPERYPFSPLLISLPLGDRWVIGGYNHLEKTLQVTVQVGETKCIVQLPQGDSLSMSTHTSVKKAAVTFSWTPDGIQYRFTESVTPEERAFAHYQYQEQAREFAEFKARYREKLTQEFKQPQS